MMFIVHGLARMFKSLCADSELMAISTRTDSNVGGASTAIELLEAWIRPVVCAFKLRRTRCGCATLWPGKGLAGKQFLPIGGLVDKSSDDGGRLGQILGSTSSG